MRKLEITLRIKFGIWIIPLLLICLFIIREGSSYIVDHVKDTQDYRNGLWKVEELKVLEIESLLGEGFLIETQEKEHELFLESIGTSVRKGGTYRFTYLERTGTVLLVK